MPCRETLRTRNFAKCQARTADHQVGELVAAITAALREPCALGNEMRIRQRKLCYNGLRHMTSAPLGPAACLSWPTRLPCPLPPWTPQYRMHHAPPIWADTPVRKLSHLQQRQPDLSFWRSCLCDTPLHPWSAAPTAASRARLLLLPKLQCNSQPPQNFAMPM